MAITSAASVQEISASGNPRLTIVKSAGDLSGIEVLANLVLVGTFIRPEKTAGGIYRPQTNVEEDRFQSKIGLVLKSGPLAFAEWEEDKERGQNAAIGSWVVFSVGDTWALTIRGTSCRLVPYDKIRLRVKDPEVVF